MYACAPQCLSVTTQNGGRSLDVLRASRRLDRGSKQSGRSFFLRFQEAQRPIGGTPKIGLDPLCLKEATICLLSHINLVMSGFAHHKGDLGLSTFGGVHWSVVGEVAPPSTSGTRLKVENPETDPQRYCLD